MTAADLPPVQSPGEAFLAAIARRQDETNRLLAQILTRLPAAPAESAAPVVELREPAAPQPDAEQHAEPAAPSPEPPPPAPARRRTKSSRTSKKET